MERFEILLKIGLLYVFSLLNAIDIAQTLHFLRLGIESNPFAVCYPQLWFLLKFVFTFGLPIAVYRLHVYLKESEDGGFHDFLKSLLLLLYFTVLLPTSSTSSKSCETCLHMEGLAGSRSIMCDHSKL